MIGNYVNLEYIIEKVQDLVPSYATYNVDKVKEWIYECLRMSGGRYISQTDTIVLNLEDGKCNIPDDIEDIVSVYYKTIKLLPTNRLDKNSYFNYLIQNSVLYTSVKDGEIELDVSYFPVDERDYPLVPNLEYYIKCVTCYIVERIMRSLLLEGKITSDIYMMAKTEYSYYSSAARCASIMPRKDEDIVIANEKLRHLPSGLHRFSKFIKTVNVIPHVEVTDLDDLIMTQNPVGFGLPLTNK